MATNLRGQLGRLGLTLGAVGAAAGLGNMSVVAGRSTLVALVGAGVAAEVLVVAPDALALFGAPTAYLPVRLPLPGQLFLPDALALVAGGVAIGKLEWEVNRRLRSLIARMGAYLAVIFISVISNFSLVGAFEIAHRGVIVVGGLLIGAYLVQADKAVSAARLYLGASAVVAVAAVATTLATHLLPAYPMGLQKNYAGSLLASALLISLAIPGAGRRHRLVLRVTQATLFAGLVATQSKGALVGLAVGGLLWAFLNRKSRALTLTVVILGLPVIAWAINAEWLSGDPYGPTATRLQLVQLAINAWLSSPVLGNGLRFYLTSSTGLPIDPHDAVLLTLAETGIVGLIAFAGLQFVAIRATLFERSLLATTACAVIVSRLVHGMFDVYWVHGSQEIPWIVIGMALSSGGALDAIRRRGSASRAPQRGAE